MRKFASIPPRVWQSDLKGVRGDLEAIAVHYHVTTSGHANMLGLYYLPLAYIAHELGCPIEGASKGLSSLIEAKICSYDFDRDLIWVHEMAADQIAPQLSPKDKRVVGIADQLSMFPICPITLGFYGRYRLPFHLFDERNLAEYEEFFAGLPEAPSMPLRSKEKEKEQEKDLGQGKEQSCSGGEEKTRDDEESMFTPFPIPPSIDQGKSFLEEKGVPQSRMADCLRSMMVGNFSPYDLEGVLSEARSAA